MDPDTKFLFLSDFPALRDVTAGLYSRRRDFIPANPESMVDLDIDLSLFKYSEDGEMVVKGDTLTQLSMEKELFSSLRMNI